MRRIHDLISRLAAEEAALGDSLFLAPRVRGGAVRARVGGLVRTFAARPDEFEGWGLFRPADAAHADLVEEASLPKVLEYLTLLPAARFRLAHALQGQAWLAYPVNEGDALQRWGRARPEVLHLVTEGARFEQVVARRDGDSWWFEEVDRRAEPQTAERLDTALREQVPPDGLRFPGLTPEMRTAYELAAQQEEAFREILRQRRTAHREAQCTRAERQAARRGEERLREALQLAGGALQRAQDRGAFWLVEWTTRDGELHTSAIEKRDLTVVSSGICLSGRDRDFDLQSLVGVMEARDE